MKSGDAKELYSKIPYASKVIIEYPNQPFRTIKSGDVGSDVLEIQKALKKHGYFGYYCDGKFGRITSKSVKKFQNDYGLSQTGMVNKSTYDLLMGL